MAKLALNKTLNWFIHTKESSKAKICKDNLNYWTPNTFFTLKRDS